MTCVSIVSYVGRFGSCDDHMKLVAHDVALGARHKLASRRVASCHGPVSRVGPWPRRIRSADVTHGTVAGVEKP
jgi:hypothetical protein